MSIEDFHKSCTELDGDTDGTLRDYIVPTKPLAELTSRSSRRSVVVGLKGIGKSSSFRYLTEFDSSPDVCIAINPETHILNLPERRLNYSAVRRQFEHDLVIEALKQIVSNEKLVSKCGTELMRKAKKSVDAYIDAVKRFVKNIKSVGFSVLGYGFNIARDNVTLVGLVEADDVADATDTLKKICATGVSVRIVVDDPELVFSTSQVLDPHLIGGFCLAAARLTAAIPGFRIIGFIKTHVYHPVLATIEDLSKYPEHMIRLGWTKDELTSLVGNRLKWAKIGWPELIAPPEGKSLIGEMAEMVRNGPRDLLRWIDLSLSRSDGKPFARRQVMETRARAAADALREMESAHASRYEKLGNVVRTIFSSAPDKEFSLDELREHIETVMVRDRRFRSLAGLQWVQSESSDGLPNRLLEVGALALRLGGQTICPYHPDYDERGLEKADGVMLAPGLVAAIGRSKTEKVARRAR